MCSDQGTAGKNRMTQLQLAEKLGVLSSEGVELFMRYFKEYLITMFEQYPKSITTDIPRDFALNLLLVLYTFRLLIILFCFVYS